MMSAHLTAKKIRLISIVMTQATSLPLQLISIGTTAVLTLTGFQIKTLAAPGDFSYSKYSAFGAELDSSPPTTQCPRCDSTVSFTVYETINNWQTELGLTPTTLFGDTDGTEQYVLLYQVVNTDTIPPEPDGPNGAQLVEFFLAVEQGQTPYFGGNPYKSGGYVPDTVFNSASSATTPLDAPSDRQVDSDLTFSGFQPLASAVEPDAITYGLIADDEVALRGGSTPTNGITFSFNPLIPITDPNGPGGLGTSSLLFLTADEDWFQANVNPNQGIAIGFPWGRTESIHPQGQPANGTSGDVVGLNITNVPEPSTMFGLLALGILGLRARKPRGRG